MSQESTTLYSITLAAPLASRLAGACERLAEILRGTESLRDEGVRAQRERLLPAAYRDDDEAAAEFRRYVENDLVERKAGGAERIAVTLREAVSEAPQITVTLTRPEMLEWAVALTDVRLAAAVTLGIVDDESARDAAALADPVQRDRWELYDWFGRLQERVVESLDDALD